MPCVNNIMEMRGAFIWEILPVREIFICMKIFILESFRVNVFSHMIQKPRFRRQKCIHYFFLQKVTTEFLMIHFYDFFNGCKIFFHTFCKGLFLPRSSCRHIFLKFILVKNAYRTYLKLNFSGFILLNDLKTHSFKYDFARERHSIRIIVNVSNQL